MKNFAKLFFTLCLVVLQISTASAQIVTTATLRDLYFEEKYADVIEYSGYADSLDAKGIYYIGMAYYMKENDEYAMKYLDKAIAKGPADHDMYFYKGRIYFYRDDYKQAMPLFDKAIAMYADEPDFYIAKAEIYEKQDKIDLAIENYEKAIKYKTCNGMAHINLGSIYQNKNKNTDALRVFKTGFDWLNSDDENHQVFSFNIGLLQYLIGDTLASKNTYEKHLITYPDDYAAVAKLIQAYYGLGMYDKAAPLKVILYDAQKRKALKKGMATMFCFDQFMWNGKRIMAFEHYGDVGGDEDIGLFVKHGFYVVDENGDIEYKIESESSAGVRMVEGKKYLLCLVKDGIHHSYWDYLFNDNYNYPDLKQAVLAILNKKNTPPTNKEKKKGKKSKRD